MDVTAISAMLTTSPVPPSELARRSGVSRNTVWGLRHDPSRARLGTLRELALALGLDLTIESHRASDPDASAAARWLLGDLETATDDIRTWSERLSRWVGGDAPLELLRQAATVSSPQQRREAILLKGRNDPDRLASAGISSMQPWALSGGVGLAHLGVDVPMGLATVFWANDPRQVRELLGPTHTPTKVPGVATVIIAPATEQVLDGLTSVDGVPLVTPVQAVIDCLGVGGQLGELAMATARQW